MTALPFSSAALKYIILVYSSPYILQPSILRPPLIIRPLDMVPKGNILC